MKIAFFGKFDARNVNGVAVSGFYIAQELVKLNHKVYLYYFSDKEDFFFDESGIRHRTFTPPTIKYAKSKKLALFLKDNPDQIDIFHLHGVFTEYNYHYSKVLRKQTLPYVLTTHGNLCPYILRRRRLLKLLYIHLFEKFVIQKADGIIAVSKPEVEDIKYVGYEGRLIIIPNPVPDHHPHKNLRYSLPKDQQITILYLGRYDIEHKGLLFLLKTFQKINSQNKHVKLVLHGHGPDEEKLKQILQINQIENVEILPPVYGSEKEKIIKNCTIYFQPSKWEVFGISIVEAMMAGKPVVITTGCYLAPLLQYHSLGLIVPFDVDKASQAILKYIDEPLKLIEEGRKCRDFAIEEFAPFKVATLTAQFYKKIISLHQQHTPYS